MVYIYIFKYESRITESNLPLLQFINIGNLLVLPSILNYSQHFAILY